MAIGLDKDIDASLSALLENFTKTSINREYELRGLNKNNTNVKYEDKVAAIELFYKNTRRNLPQKQFWLWLVVISCDFKKTYTKTKLDEFWGLYVSWQQELATIKSRIVNKSKSTQKEENRTSVNNSNPKTRTVKKGVRTFVDQLFNS